MQTLDDLIEEVDADQLEMNLRIHPILDALCTETVVWAIQECLAREKCREETSLPKTSKPVPKEAVSEEQVVYLLRFALGFSEEDRAEKLANIISKILEQDENYQYRPVFLDYVRKQKYDVRAEYS